MLCMLAPFLFAAPCLFFKQEAAASHCKPAMSGQPRGCCFGGPSFLFPLLAFLLLFPCSMCLIRFAFSVLAFTALVSVVSSAASGAGELFSDFLSSPWPTDEQDEKANKKATTTPDHSSVSVTDSESSLTLVISAPGVATKDLDVTLQPGEPPVLTIKGESTVAGTRRGVNRKIVLPGNVSFDETGAVHADGVLTLTLPKKVTPAKQINIETPTPARCSPTRKSALLAQIRGGVELKETAGPQPHAPPPAAVAEASPSAPSAESSDDENGQWEVVKELAENIDATILQELVDMGFTDRTLNAELLAKHAGSVKATVKELVAMRRAQVKSDKEAAAVADGGEK